MTVKRLRKPSTRLLLRLLVTATLCSLSAQVSAVSLSEIELKSGLHQPFKANILLRNFDPIEADRISVEIANDLLQSQYNNANYLPAPIIATLKTTAKGTVIILTSPVAIDEPFLKFAVQLNSQQGMILRQYEVLLDPPNHVRVPAPTYIPQQIVKRVEPSEVLEMADVADIAELKDIVELRPIDDSGQIYPEQISQEIEVVKEVTKITAEKLVMQSNSIPVMAKQTPEAIIFTPKVRRALAAPVAITTPAVVATVPVTKKVPVVAAIAVVEEAPVLVQLPATKEHTLEIHAPTNIAAALQLESVLSSSEQSQISDIVIGANTPPTGALEAETLVETVKEKKLYNAEVMDNEAFMKALDQYSLANLLNPSVEKMSKTRVKPNKKISAKLTQTAKQLKTANPARATRATRSLNARETMSNAAISIAAQSEAAISSPQADNRVTAIEPKQAKLSSAIKKVMTNLSVATGKAIGAGSPADRKTSTAKPESAALKRAASIKNTAAVFEQQPSVLKEVDDDSFIGSQADTATQALMTYRENARAGKKSVFHPRELIKLSTRSANQISSSIPAE